MCRSTALFAPLDGHPSSTSVKDSRQRHPSRNYIPTLNLVRLTPLGLRLGVGNVQTHVHAPGGCMAKLEWHPSAPVRKSKNMSVDGYMLRPLTKGTPSRIAVKDSRRGTKLVTLKLVGLTPLGLDSRFGDKLLGN
ncbi:unnamed protein product [Laminaria digitata]